MEFEEATEKLTANVRSLGLDLRELVKHKKLLIDHVRPYTPEFVGWLRDFGQGASNYDANGHFARIQPIFNATSPNSLVPTPIPTGDRFAGLQQGNLQRCPGAASQYPTDGSAPFLDGGVLDCQPSEVPPGP